MEIFIKFSGAQPYELGFMDISQEVSGKFPPRVFFEWMDGSGIGRKPGGKGNGML